MRDLRKKWSPEKRTKFLDALRKTGNMSQAAQSVGMGSRHMYNLREKDKEFAADWEAVMEEYADTLESEADRRAVEGVHVKTYFDKDGKVIGEERRYSDTLLIFRLKGLRPEKYKERMASEVVSTVRYEDDAARQQRIAELLQKRSELAALSGDGTGKKMPEA